VRRASSAGPAPPRAAPCTLLDARSKGKAHARLAHALARRGRRPPAPQPSRRPQHRREPRPGSRYPERPSVPQHNVNGRLSRPRAALRLIAGTWRSARPPWCLAQRRASWSAPVTAQRSVRSTRWCPRWAAGWPGGRVAGWLGGWMAGWVGGWVGRWVVWCGAEVGAISLQAPGSLTGAP
jgi:hypothetical protein